jgi:hypothetical protein
MAGLYGDLRFRKRRIFFRRGIDEKWVICPSGKISGGNRCAATAFGSGQPAFCFEVSQIFGNRRNPSQQKMFSRPRAGDVEQSPFGFVDIVQFRFVGGVGNALVEGKTPSSQGA